MNSKLYFFKRFCFGIILTVGLFCSALSVRAEGLNVEVHSKDEIRNYISSSGSKNNKITYDAEPVLTIPPSQGKLSMNSLANALAELNTVRYIAGLNADVFLDPAYTEMAQAATFINHKNNEMSHYPGKPADVSDDQYQLGATGARSSNLGHGYSSLVSAIRDGWVEDSDSENIDRLGHRRWVLNPPMQKTGFGYTNVQL